MSEVKIPTVGRIVHYFPNGADSTAAHNNALAIPAIVIQAWGNLSVNLQAFTMNPDAPNILRFSVVHATEIPEGADRSFWDWPEVK